MDDEGYIYEVVYEDVQGETHSEQFRDPGEAAAKYDSLPLGLYKAQWQVQRHPEFIEQLQRVHNPRPSHKHPGLNEETK